MKITREQYEKLCDSKFWDSKEEFHNLLEEITGIKASQYTCYQYFDSAHNYLGDSSDCTIRDLLNSAYIEIED